MQIFVDARCLQDPRYAERGIGRHAASVIRHARRFLPQASEVVALLDSALPALSEEYRPFFTQLQSNPAPPSDIGSPTVFFQPSPMTHPAERIAPWLTRQQIISCEIFYDLIPLDEPSRYLPTPALRTEFFTNLTWLKHYTLHAPISRHAANCLTDTLEIPSESVVVTGAAVRPAFTRFDAKNIRETPTVSRFAEREYFIQLGGSDTRKNAEAVIAAHAKLTRQGLTIGLVIAGHYVPGYQAHLLEMHRKQGGRSRDVQFTPDISDEQLTVLYHRALGCICPSKSEGFSLPVVEAIACGCPVLAASCPAQMELVLQPDALFEPDDFDTLAAKMTLLMSEPGLRDSLYRQQQPMGRRFDEVDVAARVWLAMGSHFQKWTARPIARKSVQRPRLAVLMPVTDSSTSTGRVLNGNDYFQRLLPAIAREVDVDLFSPTGVEHVAGASSVQPLSVLPYWSSRYDCVVTMLGNDARYRRLHAMLPRRGGACLTFDDRMTEFQRVVFGDASSANVAQEWLSRPVHPDEFDDWLTDVLRMPMTFFEPIARAATPLLVHSGRLQQRLRQLGLDNVVHLPPVPLRTFCRDELQPEARLAAKDRLGFRRDRLHLLIPGGNVGEWGHWEIPVVLAQLQRWGIEAEAHWLGTIGSALPFEMNKVGTKHGNVDRLSYHEIPAEEAIPTDYYLAADMAVIFRTHGLSGVPLEVLDCIAAALPTVMNQDLALGLGVESMVSTVQEPIGAFRVAEAVRQFQEMGRHQQRLQPNWERYVTERSPESYARQLLNLLREAESFRPQLRLSGTAA